MVDHRHYEQVSLTPKGTRHAQEISSRFVIVQTFLEDVLGVEVESALLDACLLEHYVSKRTIDRLIDLIRFFENEDRKDVLEQFREYRRECETEDTCRICNFHCDVVLAPDELIQPDLPGEAE